MKNIFKYNLVIDRTQTVEMPAHARILSVDNQQGNLCLWAEVDPDNYKEDRVISIYGTGNPTSSYPGIFIGSVVIDPFVWHVYEQEKKDGQDKQ